MERRGGVWSPLSPLQGSEVARTKEGADGDGDENEVEGWAGDGREDEGDEEEEGEDTGGGV